MMRPGDPPSNRERSSIELASGATPMDGRDFEIIRNLAYRTFGLDLKPGKEELVSARLGRLMRDGGFPSFQEFYRHLQQDRTGEALACLIDALATNHTSFLREPDHFDFLSETVLPGLRDRQCIEIWSAACSTGEEVWTLGCVLNDELPTRSFCLTGTDISTRALRFAQRAVYPADHCVGIPPAWLSRYFIHDPATAAYTVCPRLRAQASFRRRNLVESFSWPRPFPVIFCRNVMIYFDRPMQEQVVNRLACWLEPGGYLFVGHAESLIRVSHSLEYVRPAVYRKRREGTCSKS
jgi:chemotaxis protein methyltransferase CheR